MCKKKCEYVAIRKVNGSYLIKGKDYCIEISNFT